MLQLHRKHVMSQLQKATMLWEEGVLLKVCSTCRGGRTPAKGAPHPQQGSQRAPCTTRGDLQRQCCAGKHFALLEVRLPSFCTTLLHSTLQAPSTC